LDIIESPPDTSHKALEITVRFHIIKIREIRAVHNVADLIFVAVQTWEVPRMKEYFEDNPDAGVPLANMAEQLWVPPLVILNADSLTSSPSTPSVDWVTGVCHRKTYFNGTVTNELSQIKLFPFDWDDLRLIASSSVDARHGQKGLNLVPEANWTTSQMIPYYLESSVQEWEIFPIMSKIGIWNSETYKKKYIDTKRRMSTGRSLFNIGDKGSGRSNSYSSEPKVAAIGEEEEYVDSDIDDPDNETKNVPPKKGSVAKAESPNKKAKGLAGVEITIHVRRRYGYYLTKIILIFNVVVFMSWGLGFTPHDEIIGRLTMVFTAATAAFAFMYTVQQELPKLAFLTFIDKQMISGILSLAAQAVQAVVAFKTDSNLIDGVFSVAIPSIYVVYNTMISINVYRARSEEALHEHRESRDATAMKESQIHFKAKPHAD